MVAAVSWLRRLYGRAWGLGHGSPTVVRLRGNQNIATDEVLCATLAQAIAHGEAPVCIDLTEVGDMRLSTLAVLLRARELLRMWPRSLTLQSPPESTRRLIDICGAHDLLVPEEGWSQPTKVLAARPAVPVPGGASGQAERTVDLRAIEPRTVDLRIDIGGAAAPGPPAAAAPGPPAAAPGPPAAAARQALGAGYAGTALRHFWRLLRQGHAHG